MFGLIGYGCSVETSGPEITVVPMDGLRKGVRFVEERVDLEATQGEIDQVVFHTGRRLMKLKMSDSTGVVKSAAVRIQGLDKGEYAISHGKSPRKTDADGALTVELPMGEAQDFRIWKKA